MEDNKVPIEAWDRTRDGPLTEVALRAKVEARGYRATRSVYPPGTVFPGHRHAVDKIDAVLSGRLRLVLVGRAARLGPGDCLAVPAGAPHNAAVEGEAPVVSLDALRA